MLVSGCVTPERADIHSFQCFVKVTKMDRASDGAVFLRARYQDKDNVWHYEDSEQLKSTTTDFIHLHKTFTLPADNCKNFCESLSGGNAYDLHSIW